MIEVAKMTTKKNVGKKCVAEVSPSRELFSRVEIISLAVPYADISHVDYEDELIYAEK